MKLHPRHKAMSSARSRINNYILDRQDAYGLTDAEILMILTEFVMGSLKGAIQEERSCTLPGSDEE